MLHQRLLHKLNHYGLRGKTFQWIQSFSNNRTQSVMLEGYQSQPLDFMSGVPQGTVLESLYSWPAQVHVFSSKTIYRRLPGM